MKKKMIALIAGSLMAMSASSAFASFSDLELIRVVYQRSGGTVEVATDLGNINTILATSGSTNYGGGVNAFTTVTGSDIANSNYYVAYFAADRGTAKQLWVSGADSVTPNVGSLKTTPLNSFVGSVFSLYNTLSPVDGATSTYQTATTNGNSYYVKGSHNGSLGGVITSNLSVEASLANIANASIAQSLYFKNAYGTAGAMSKITAADGISKIQILTNADGSTTVVNPAGNPIPSTPIPAAAYLLGSGLLGLVGLRRKVQKA